MHFAPDEKMAIFIDGSHLYTVSRLLGFEVDYRNLLQFFRNNGRVVRAHYYAGLLDNGEYSPLKPLTDWLVYNGYSLLTRTVKEHVDSEGHRRIQGVNMDVDMVTDMFELAPHVDHMVLINGSGGLCRPVAAIKARGVRVTLISSIETTPHMLSDELRRIADQFIDLDAIKGQFIRQRAEVSSRVPPPAPKSATPAKPFGDEEEVATPRPRRKTTVNA